MRTPRSSIFALGTASVSYLEFDARPDCDPRAVIRLVADLRGLLRARKRSGFEER